MFFSKFSPKFGCQNIGVTGMVSGKSYAFCTIFTSVIFKAIKNLLFLEPPLLEERPNRLTMPQCARAMTHPRLVVARKISTPTSINQVRDQNFYIDFSTKQKSYFVEVETFWLFLLRLIRTTESLDN